MGRSFLNDRLLDKLTKGEYLPILNWVKSDNDLRIEMRINNQVKIYFMKSLIMTLFPFRQPKLLSSGYWKEGNQPILILDSPAKYFTTAKMLVKNHTRGIKKNIEFKIQQKIAKDNCSNKNQFLVIDMEYQFEQRKVINRTRNKTRFDLLAIDLDKNKILLLELKQGLNSLTGSSGVNDHFSRYREHIIHPMFQSALYTDVYGILWSKQRLGLFDFDASILLHNLRQAEIDYGYIFAAHSESEMMKYKEEFGDKYSTLYLNAQANNYTLHDGIQKTTTKITTSKASL